MGPWHLIVLNLVLALVAVAVVLLSVRAFLRRHPEKADAKHGRAKLVVFNLILAFVVIAVAELSVLTFLRRDPQMLGQYTPRRIGADIHGVIHAQ